MEPSTWIALGALIISGLTALHSIKVGRRIPELTELQVRQLRDMVDTGSQARIRVYVRDHPRQTPTKFIDVVNEGPADAFEVRVEVTEGTSVLPGGQLAEVFPVERMRSGEKASIMASPQMGGPRAVMLTVRWRDESGEHEEPYTARLIGG